MIVFLARDIPAFVMYCVSRASRLSLLIESTNSMIYYGLCSCPYVIIIDIEIVKGMSTASDIRLDIIIQITSEVIPTYSTSIIQYLFIIILKRSLIQPLFALFSWQFGIISCFPPSFITSN